VAILHRTIEMILGESMGDPMDLNIFFILLYYILKTLENCKKKEKKYYVACCAQLKFGLVVHVAVQVLLSGQQSLQSK